MTRMRNKLAALISVAFGSPHHIYEGQSLAGEGRGRAFVHSGRRVLQYSCLH